MDNIRGNVSVYLKLVAEGSPGVYRNCLGGKETLYASCFAVMCYRYINKLDCFSEKDLQQWADYILRHQDKDGRFMGPEIQSGKLLSSAHSADHLAWHTTCHVLPALKLLGATPRYSLSFVEPYLDPGILAGWLEARNWNEAWLEGNNLLFMGQLLTFLAVEENNIRAKKNINLFFEWLDSKIDPATGLWGTDGATDSYAAAYGGYHQLLLYYYWQHDLRYKEELIDTVLGLQHFDGGFSREWGGGSCEDVDCVDILVNLYKLTDYRHSDIEYSLLKAARAVLRRQARDGGFVYKKGEEFYHMGMDYTYAPPGVANMFSTWFGVHTVCLIAEIIEIPELGLPNGSFNDTCSMGWHRPWHRKPRKLSFLNNCFVTMIGLCANLYFSARTIKRSSTALSRLYRQVKGLWHIKK